MIEVSYKHMNEFPVLKTFQELVSRPLPAKLAYDIGKMGQAIDQGERGMRSEYIALIKEHVKDWDPSKKLEVQGEAKETLEAAESKFFESGVLKVERIKIDFMLIENLSLTPAQVLALEPFFTEPEQDDVA